jgi:hypothetical protein
MFEACLFNDVLLYTVNTFNETGQVKVSRVERVAREEMS